MFNLLGHYAQVGLHLVPAEICEIVIITHQNLPILSLVVALLANILNLLSLHADMHASAAPVITTLLSPLLQRRLHGYLIGTQHELIVSTLKLYNALANFGNGKEQKAVLENFNWGHKSLPKLLYMRRKGGDGKVDDLTRPGKCYYCWKCLSVTIWMSRYSHALHSVHLGFHFDAIIFEWKDSLPRATS